MFYIIFPLSPRRTRVYTILHRCRAADALCSLAKWVYRYTAVCIGVYNRRRGAARIVIITTVRKRYEFYRRGEYQTFHILLERVRIRDEYKIHINKYTSVLYTRADGVCVPCASAAGEKSNLFRG